MLFKRQSILTFSLLILSTTAIFAQGLRNSNLRNVGNSFLTSKLINKKWNPTDFIGSPYYDSQYKLGKVYYQDSLIISEVLLRYNVMKESIEITSKIGGEAESIQSKPGISFDYGDEHFQLMFNPITGMKQFFRKVYDGPMYKVYLKPLKDFKEGQKAVTHLTRDIKPTYLTRDTYYYQLGKSFVEIKQNRRGVRKIFEDHRDEIKDYIKENDFRFSEDTFEWELTQVIRHYESMTSDNAKNGDIVK